MAVHVFIGAGPANLDRALRIAETQPDAKIMIIDNRLVDTPVDRSKKIFIRDNARSNIFFFDQNTAESIKKRLTAQGIHAAEISKQMYERHYGLEKQDRAGQSFFMIQIRDLQNFFIRALYSIFEYKADSLFFISKKLSSDEKTMTQEVMALLEENHIKEDQVKIHLATGALQDNNTESILYPAQAKIATQISPDVNAMPVVPLHITGTFNIQETSIKNEIEISCEELENQQQALATTQWKDPLIQYGWTLVRPPSVRVFFSHDVLYIGTEFPASIASETNKTKRETLSRGYLQAIAKLMFPHIPIEALTLKLGADFKTERGEHGQFQTTNENITILRHGDARYLPHYQTASGFVIAQAQNDLYAQIQQQTTFSSLFEWAKTKKLIENKTEAQVLKSYTKMLGDNPHQILEAFKSELFNAGARDIIDANKAKVGEYLSGLQKQSLDQLTKQLPLIIAIYNKTHESHLSQSDLASLADSDRIIHLLKSNNAEFLRQILPLIVNEDITAYTEEDLYLLRDAEINIFRKIVPENKSADSKTIHLISLSQYHTQDLIQIVTKLAQSLETNKTLHHRAATSFFKGVHSDSIHHFAKDIQELVKKNPPTLKQDLLDRVVKFEEMLQKGNSKRTLHAFKEEIKNLESEIKFKSKYHSKL